MDIKEVLISVAVVVIALFGIFAFMGNLNASYGTSMGDTFNESININDLLQNVTSAGTDLASTTQAVEASAQESQTDSLYSQARSAFSITTRLLGIVPKLIKQAAIAFKIPEPYWKVGQAIFISVFGLTIAYILLLGVRRLVG